MDPDNDRIFTYIKIRINETMKGEIRSRKIVLKEEGGEVDGQGSIIFGAPRFSIGEQVFLYLDTWPDGSLRVHQMSFGKLSILSPPDGRQMVVRSQATCGANLEPTRHSAHSLAPISAIADLSDYKRIVQARFKALTSRSQAFQLEHYRDTPMLDDPPEYDRAKNKREIHPQFKLLFPIRSVRWFEPDLNQPVIFYINPDGAPNPQVVEDVGAAILAWSNVEGSTLRVVNGGPRNVCSVERTLNAISFNNCDGRFSPSAECSRIIALGGLRWSSDATRQINGQSYVQAEYGFISFNPYSACSFNNHCDLREVATHELGHTLGLGHSQRPEATMFGAAHFDGRCASLTQDDVDGIAFVYPTNDGGSRPLAIETTSLPDAVKLVNHIQTLNATGGVLPHTWTLVDFLGRPPTGLSLSTGGILFGLPSDTGTFSFTVQVTDGEGSSVQRHWSMSVRDPIPYDSQFMSQTVVPPVQAGQQFGVVLKWVNNGSEIWDGSIKPLAQNPANNTTWRATIAPVSSLTPKGMTREIRLTAIAPNLGGTYGFQWQLHQEGRGFFGQPSGNMSITVVPGPPMIDISSPPQGFVGSSYSYQLAVIGGTAPHVWSLSSGSLPPGLVLNPGTGLISGTPTSIGTATFTAQVTDSVSRAAQRQYSITIAQAPALPLRLIVAASLQSVRGTPFDYRPEATGGSPPSHGQLRPGRFPPD